MNNSSNPLGDLSPQDFLENVWQQQPLVVRQAFPGFESPISADELAGLSCEPDVNSRIVIEKGGKHPWQTLYGPMDEAVFQELPATHWSLLVNDVEKHLPELVWIMDRFRFIPDLHYWNYHCGFDSHIIKKNNIPVQSNPFCYGITSISNPYITLHNNSHVGQRCTVSQKDRRNYFGGYHIDMGIRVFPGQH